MFILLSEGMYGMLIGTLQAKKDFSEEQK